MDAKKELLAIVTDAAQVENGESTTPGYVDSLLVHTAGIVTIGLSVGQLIGAVTLGPVHLEAIYTICFACMAVGLLRWLIRANRRSREIMAKIEGFESRLMRMLNGD